MISIVTGTLNRKNLLKLVIDNTVKKSDKLELVLVDGGSTDGTIEYVKDLNNPQIKLIEVGKRSSYPHFMNLGITNSKYDFVCQWNDDVILINDWDEIFKEIDDSDFYIFNWKYGNLSDIYNEKWKSGNDHSNYWFLLCNKDNNGNGSIVMNYGIYNKKIFKEIGMYNMEYNYYYADGDMAERAYYFGYKYKILKNIKVCSINTEKKAKHNSDDKNIFDKNIKLYKNKELPKSQLCFL